MKKIISLFLAIVMLCLCLGSCRLNVFCSHNNPRRIVLVQGYPAQDYVEGLTDGWICLNCGEMVIPQTIIPQLISSGNANTDTQDKQYKLGMGVAFGEFTNSQINATIASVVLDNNGKIVACRIDAVYNRYNIDLNDEIINFTNFKSKVELGYDYNMSKYGTSLIGNNRVKEWFEQAQAFENWAVGKTVDEIANMPLRRMPNGYVISADQDLLNAGCTISIEDFRNAVVKACNDDQGAYFITEEPIKLGIAANSMDNGSQFYDEYVRVKMTVYLATSVVVDGKIVASINDAIAPEIHLDWEQNVIETSVGKGAGILKTHRELKEDYKMSLYGTGMDWNGDGVVKEWYEQSAAFSNHVVGMTANEVANMPTKQIENGYIVSADDALLSAGCTIMITEMKEIVAKSVQNAR